MIFYLFCSLSIRWRFLSGAFNKKDHQNFHKSERKGYRITSIKRRGRLLNCSIFKGRLKEEGRLIESNTVLGLRV